MTNTLRREVSDFILFQMKHGYITHQVPTAVLREISLLIALFFILFKYSKCKRLCKNTAEC